MFVPESNHVSQFVYYNTELVTVLTDTYGLWTISPLTHETATSVGKEMIQNYKNKPML